MHAVLTINPGSTSTKIGFFSRSGPLQVENFPFAPEKLQQNVADEFPRRLADIESFVMQGMKELSLQAAVGRGGPLKPLPGGVYSVNENMLADLRSAKYSNHASNLGAMLAHHFSQRFRIPAFIIDPVTVDEFNPLARISGHPDIPRKSRSHALNIKATARKICDQENWDLDSVDLVVAHLGGGISIAALKSGMISDVNDGLLGMGPFSPERAGALPIGALARMAAQSSDIETLLHQLSRESGLKAYLGTSDARLVEDRIALGEEKARLIYDAMIYQIKKEIGAMMAACSWTMKAVIVTGGLAQSVYIQNALKNAAWPCPLFFWPGENELEAMADGAFRALDGKIRILEYIS